MRRKRTRDIVIELTSLLDIVMILIFAVMIQNAKLVEASENKAYATQVENESLQAENESLVAESDKLGIALDEALIKLEEGQIEDLVEKLSSVQNRVDAYDYMKEIVVVYSVSLENKYQNSQRFLTYGDVREPENETVKIRRTDKEGWNLAVNNLKIALNEFVRDELAKEDEEKYIYIVFSLDETLVFDSDYYTIDEALREIEDRFGVDHVRYRLDILNNK